MSVSGPAGTKYPLPIVPAVLVSLLTWIAVPVSEELVFRGYQLKNLAEGLAGRRLDARMSMTCAAVISSIVFSSAHFVNGNATTWSLLNVFLGGLLLSLPVVLTGQLAPSIGLHISWNFFEGTVYGFAVSGTPQSTHILTIQQTGPDLWTGGAFGPEGGLVCTGWMLFDSALVAAWLRLRRGPRRGH